MSIPGTGRAAARWRRALQSMALAGLALFGSYAGAQAQSAAGANADQHADPAGYAAVIDEALAEHRGGNFEEARALFAKAHALFPNARTLRGMGMMEFELRDYAASATHLEQALASSVRPLRGELRDSTAVLLARAQGFVGKLSLEVQPASASVLLDGLVVTLHPDRPLLLNFGEHVLEVRAPGYLRETRKVTMRSGEEQRLLVELTAAEHGAEPAPEGPGLTNGGRSASQDGGPGALPWVLVGGGGALMIGGGVLLAMSQADIDEVEGASKPATWSSESQDAYDAAPVKSGVGFALLGVGAVSATIGLVWALGGDESDARADRVRVTWSGQRVAIGGRF